MYNKYSKLREYINSLDEEENVVMKPKSEVVNNPINKEIDKEKMINRILKNMDLLYSA